MLPISTNSARRPPGRAVRMLALLVLALVAVNSWSCARSPNRAWAKGAKKERNSFQEEIKPIFEYKCLECHNSRIRHGNLDLTTRELAFRPLPNGAIPIVAGRPEASRILTVIQLPDTQDEAMPPTRHRLTAQQIDAIKSWIAAGAPWPLGADGKLYPIGG